MRIRHDVIAIITELSNRIALLFPQDKIEAILFGSYARGDADSGSDIDVLFLADASRQDISDRNWQVGNLAAELLLEHGIVVSPLVENREYFNRNLQVFPFYRSVAHDCEDFKKHSAVIARFTLNYLKPEILPREYNKLISNASLIRNRSDYEDFYICSVEDTKALFSGAVAF